MNWIGKTVLFAAGAAVLAVSAWGWLQVPKLLKGDLFAEFDPQYRACTETQVNDATRTACDAVLASRALEPGSRAKVLIHRGVYYNLTKRYRDAIRDFDAVLALSADKTDPFALAALSDRSYAEEMLGEDAKAWADANRAIALAPDNATGYDARAFLHQHAGDFAHAAQDYDPLVRLKPDDAYGWNNRCWLRAIADQLPGALEDCNRAIAIAPRYAAALDSRAFVYYRMGEYAKARDEYDQAVLAGSYASATFYMRGLSKMKLGAPTGGEADIAQAKSLDPGVAERFAGYGVKP